MTRYEAVSEAPYAATHTHRGWAVVDRAGELVEGAGLGGMHLSLLAAELRASELNDQAQELLERRTAR